MASKDANLDTSDLDEVSVDATEESEETNENYEEMAFADDEMQSKEDEGEIAPEPLAYHAPIEVRADGGLGAFTALLALSLVAYITAAALVVYQVSEYAAPGFFPWSANMP